jgi:hypothetical protein
MTRFNQGSLDIFRAERLWRDLLPSTLLKILKIDKPGSLRMFLVKSVKEEALRLYLHVDRCGEGSKSKR